MSYQLHIYQYLSLMVAFLLDIKETSLQYQVYCIILYRRVSFYVSWQWNKQIFKTG
jgi:hypothetical protein